MRLIFLLLPVLLLVLTACRSMPDHTFSGGPRISHDVYFALTDPSRAQELIDDCYEMLGGIPGIVVLHAGTREQSLDREVNDVDFHVGLHVLFEDLAAHDFYATAPLHLEFIEKNKEMWTGVRVFDSVVVSR